MHNDMRAAFLDQLVATPAGRAHVLSISVEAEEGDEGGVFDRVAEIVNDPKLRRIVEVHRDDEVRHAQLFRDCLSRLDLELQPVPDELRIIPRIAAGAGGLITGLSTTADVVNIYAVLHAIEERGVEQFPLIADAFRAVDPETADTYLRVTRDERGHVRYCEQIGRHYSADDRAWEQLVDRARAVEQTAFDEVRAADLAYCTERGLLAIDALQSS
jgi:rubrerythrin